MAVPPEWPRDLVCDLHLELGDRDRCCSPVSRPPCGNVSSRVVIDAVYQGWLVATSALEHWPPLPRGSEAGERLECSRSPAESCVLQVSILLP
jgi:hypothetical protein